MWNVECGINDLSPPRPPLLEGSLAKLKLSEYSDLLKVKLNFSYMEGRWRGTFFFIYHLSFSTKCVAYDITYTRTAKAENAVADGILL